MIILIGSQKGGPGKTTIAVNLAVEFARQGKDVVLVDADSQRSAARWHADREEQGHTPRIACVEKLGSIHLTLQDLANRYDTVIVDVAGKDSQEFKDYCGLLYTQALLIEGILPENPVEFANKVAELMAK